MDKVRALFMIGLSCLLLVCGCAQKPQSASSKEAINKAAALETVQQKADFLIGEAQAFYNSEKFQDAVDLAQYVLNTLDKDSQAAKDLVEKAKQALAQAVESAASDLKEKALNLGK